jgi:hypothetical protein
MPKPRLKARFPLERQIHATIKESFASLLKKIGLKVVRGRPKSADVEEIAAYFRLELRKVGQLQNDPKAGARVLKAIRRLMFSKHSINGALRRAKKVDANVCSGITLLPADDPGNMDNPPVLGWVVYTEAWNRKRGGTK